MELLIKYYEKNDPLVCLFVIINPLIINGNNYDY